MTIPLQPYRTGNCTAYGEYNTETDAFDVVYIPDAPEPKSIFPQTLLQWTAIASFAAVALGCFLVAFWLYEMCIGGK